jgi:hypothetical protein
LLPTMIWAARAFAGVGAASVMAALSLVSLMLVSSLVLSRLLPGEFSRWLARIVIIPLATATAIASLLRYTLPLASDRVHAIAQLALAGMIISAANVVLLPHPRATLLLLVRRLR